MAFVIAEAGSNWYIENGTKEQMLARALKLIEMAAGSRASAVKFQLFDRLYRDEEAQGRLNPMRLPPEWIPTLATAAEEESIEFMCTPFSLRAVDLIDPYVKRHKIASWDMTYSPLLAHVAKKKKPVIMSTGGSTFPEIEEAIQQGWGHYKHTEDIPLTLMHCTGGYPTPLGDIVLRRILDLSQEFMPLNVGFSAHIVSPHIVAAAALYMFPPQDTARVFEVHFDLADGKGVETRHSYTPGRFAELVRLIDEVERAMDCNCTTTLSDEIGRTSYRRSPTDWLRPPLDGDYVKES